MRVIVYFILAKRCNRIKIGSTTNINRRVYELSTSCPDDVVLLGVMPSDGRTEVVVHKKFRHFRVQGEWFDADQSIHDYIAANCSKATVCPTHIEEINRRAVRNREIEAKRISQNLYEVKRYEATKHSAFLQKAYHVNDVDEITRLRAVVHQLNSDFQLFAKQVGRTSRLFTSFSMPESLRTQFDKDLSEYCEHINYDKWIHQPDEVLLARKAA